MKKIYRIIIITLSLILIFKFIATPFRQANQGYLAWHILSKISYFFQEPQINDLIGIKLSGDSVFILAKIIELPNQEFLVKANRIILNNQKSFNNTKHYPDGKRLLKASEYLISTAASSSQDEEIGIITKERIIGKVIW